MTSDAKIGLLLGLVFIFIIAFIINGLPGLSQDSHNNTLTAEMVDSGNKSLGIAAHERKITREIISRPKQIVAAGKPIGETQPDIRFTGNLPKISSAVRKTANQETLTLKPPAPKYYVVREGDNLAAIARKFYGPIEGNKETNITAIFQANRKLLVSPDRLYIGQRLLIPPLRRQLTNEPPSASAKSYNRYIVQEGDSLWEIAAEQLGNPNRYIEIARLNTAVLDDTDRLKVGMHLKLPVR